MFLERKGSTTLAVRESCGRNSRWITTEEKFGVKKQCFSASHLADISFHICTGQSEFLHFYSLNPSVICSNPKFTQDIKQRGSSCNTPTRTAAREIFGTHLTTVEVILPGNFNVFLSQLLHQVVIRKTNLWPWHHNDITVQQNLPNVTTVALGTQSGAVLRDSNPLLSHPSLEGQQLHIFECWGSLN